MKSYFKNKSSNSVQSILTNLRCPRSIATSCYVSVNSKPDPSLRATPGDSHVFTAPGGRVFAQLSLPGGFSTIYLPQGLRFRTLCPGVENSPFQKNSLGFAQGMVGLGGGDWYISQVKYILLYIINKSIQNWSY